MERITSVNVDNSTVAGQTSNVVGAEFMTLNIQNDGTNRTFSYFINGGWVQFYQEASGSFLTETSAGFGAASQTSNASYFASVILSYWNVQ